MDQSWPGSPAGAIVERTQAAVVRSAFRRPYGRLLLTLELLAFCTALVSSLHGAPWPICWGLYWYTLFYGLRCGDWLVIALTGLDNHAVKIGRRVVNIAALLMLFVWALLLRAIRHRYEGQSHSWWCLGGLLGFHTLSAFCLGAFLFTAEEMETIANLETGGAQFIEGSDTYDILPGGDTYEIIPSLEEVVAQEAAARSSEASPAPVSRLPPARTSPSLAAALLSAGDKAEEASPKSSPRWLETFRTPSPRGSAPAALTRSRAGSGSGASVPARSRLGSVGSQPSLGRRTSMP